MAASGSPFQSPRACPFVALELDRDRRAERPDYRHRCFAEPTPAPRSMAHQEAYCLSPNFAACPIFQDWAVRAAAAPVGAPLATSMGQTTTPAAAVLGDATATPEAASGVADGPGAHEPVDAQPVERPQEQLAYTSAPDEPPLGEPPLVEPPPLDSETVRAPDSSAWQRVSDAEQLSVFASPGDRSSHDDEPRSSLGQPDAGFDEPPDLPLPEAPPGYVAPPARSEPADRSADRDEPVEDPALPAFLAGRAPRGTPASSAPASSAPAPAASPAGRPSERVTRDEVVPSWDIDDRYGAAPPVEPRGGGSRLDNVLTAIAVIAILLLGVAGVIFLPGLLAGGGPTRTPGASLVVPSARPTAVATAGSSGSPTVAPATTEPTVRPSASAGPIGSPRYYRIRVGDSLASIANRFDISVDELLAANPDIVDPNYIQVGQSIIIPRPPDD